MPMITMYAVANIDSALWGTRSVGEVKNASTDTAGSGKDTGTDSNSVTYEAVRQNRSDDNGRDSDGNYTGGGGIMMRAITVPRGQRQPQPAASGADEEQAVPLEGESSGVVADGSDGDGDASAREAEKAETEACRVGERGGSSVAGRGNLSLRDWKFVMLASWILFSVGLTASYLRWRLYKLAALIFFSQAFGLVFFIVAAWLEMRLQRSYALPLPSAPQG